jgi:hypothetical protein
MAPNLRFPSPVYFYGMFRKTAACLLPLIFCGLFAHDSFAGDVKLARRFGGNVIPLGDDLFAVTADRGVILGLKRDGSVQWTYEGVSGRRLVASRQLLVASKAKTVYAIGDGISALGFDGSELWKIPDFKGSEQGALLDEASGLILAIKSDLSLCAFTIEGKIAWHVDTGLDSTIPICTIGQTVVVVNILGNLEGYSLLGEISFRQDFEARVASMASDGKELYCVFADGSFATVNKDGGVTSKANLGIQRVCSLLIQPDGGFVCAFGDSIAGFSKKGRENWRVAIDGSTITQMQWLGNGQLFVGTEDCGWAVCGTKGTIIRKGRIENNPVSTSAVSLESGRIVFGTELGKWVER